MDAIHTLGTKVMVGLAKDSQHNYFSTPDYLFCGGVLLMLQGKRIVVGLRQTQ